MTRLKQLPWQDISRLKKGPIIIKKGRIQYRSFLRFSPKFLITLLEIVTIASIKLKGPILELVFSWTPVKNLNPIGLQMVELWPILDYNLAKYKYSWMISTLLVKYYYYLKSQSLQSMAQNMLKFLIVININVQKWSNLHLQFKVCVFIRMFA